MGWDGVSKREAGRDGEREEREESRDPELLHEIRKTHMNAAFASGASVRTPDSRARVGEGLELCFVASSSFPLPCLTTAAAAAAVCTSSLFLSLTHDRSMSEGISECVREKEGNDAPPSEHSPCVVTFLHLHPASD